MNPRGPVFMDPGLAGGARALERPHEIIGRFHSRPGMPGSGVLRYHLSLNFPVLEPERLASSSGKQITVWLPVEQPSGMFRATSPCFRRAGKGAGRRFYFWGLSA